MPSAKNVAGAAGSARSAGKSVCRCSQDHSRNSSSSTDQGIFPLALCGKCECGWRRVGDQTRRRRSTGSRCGSMFDLRCERALKHMLCGFGRKKWVGFMWHLLSRVLQTCALIGDISVIVEDPACAESENSSKRCFTVDARNSNWLCVGMGHHIAGPPSLLQVSRVRLRILLVHVLAKPHIALQGRVCTLTGNRIVWLSSMASQYPPDFCRKFAQAVDARDPAWRWTAAVLAATTQQVGHSLHWVGIRCRVPRERVDAGLGREWQKRPRLLRTVECDGQSVKECEAQTPLEPGWSHGGARPLSTSTESCSNDREYRWKRQ